MEGRVDVELRVLRIGLSLQALLFGALTAWLLAGAASLAATPPCTGHVIDCNNGLGGALAGALTVGLVGLVLTLALGASAVLLRRAPSAWTVAVTVELVVGSVMVTCLLYATQAGELLLVPGGFLLLTLAELAGLFRRGLRLRCTPAARGRGVPPRPR